MLFSLLAPAPFIYSHSFADHLSLFSRSERSALSGGLLVHVGHWHINPLLEHIPVAHQLRSIQLCNLPVVPAYLLQRHERRPDEIRRIVVPLPLAFLCATSAAFTRSIPVNHATSRILFFVSDRRCHCQDYSKGISTYREINMRS